MRIQRGRARLRNILWRCVACAAALRREAFIRMIERDGEAEVAEAAVQIAIIPV